MLSHSCSSGGNMGRSSSAAAELQLAATWLLAESYEVHTLEPGRLSWSWAAKEASWEAVDEPPHQEGLAATLSVASSEGQLLEATPCRLPAESLEE